MPKKKILPAHLEAFLESLEAQDPREQPDRLAALDAAETVAGRQIILADAMKYPDFRRRYARWEERLKIALADAQIGRGLAGKSSATPMIAAMGGFETPGGGGGGSGSNANGRPALQRHHAARKNDFARW